MKKKVWIIWAGPTGLSLALFLKKQWIDVEIFDLNNSTTPFSKAMIIHARTLEVFDDYAIADKFLAQWEKVENVKMLNSLNNKETFNFANIWAWLSKFPYLLFLEQSKTEKVLVKELKSLWVEINWQHELKDYHEKTKKVTLNFKNWKSFDVDNVVGCDGARSTVRHQLGYAFEWSTVDERFYVADVILESKKINKKQLYIKFAYKAFCLIFPIDRGKMRYRLIGIVPHKFIDYKELEFEDIKKDVVESLGLPITITKTHWFSTYRVHSRFCHFGGWKVFLAGDAAHIHSPAWGRGMNTGIQDSYNLAWKLAWVINWDYHEKILDTYDEERYPIAKELINSTDRLFSYVNWSVIFSFIFRNFILKVMLFIINTGLFNKKIFPFLSMLTIWYSKSSILIDSQLGSIHSWQRLPYNEIIYSQISWKNHLILTNCIDLSQFAKSHEIIEISDYLTLRTPYFIILRPDKHISYIWSDTKKITDYFSSICL